MTLFPIADAESYLRTFVPSLVRSGDNLSWACGDGVSELSITPINQRTFDGLLVSEIVTLRHTSPAFADLTPDMIAHLNSLATVSSLVPGDHSGPTQLIAKVGIFSTDQAAAERVYAPILCTEAVVSGWHAGCLMRGQFQQDPEQSPLRLTANDPPFDDADFEAIKAITDGYGWLGSLGDRGFCVEFPWEAGAVTSGLRDERFREFLRAAQGASDEQLDRWAGATGLLQISVTQHPLYGKGVQTTLELPFSPNDQSTMRMANELNAWELSGADLPPHFGAWCIGARALMYASFMPTQYCFPGLLHNLTIWMATRHARARLWMHASSSRH